MSAPRMVFVERRFGWLYDGTNGSEILAQLPSPLSSGFATQTAVESDGHIVIETTTPYYNTTEFVEPGQFLVQSNHLASPMTQARVDFDYIEVVAAP